MPGTTEDSRLAIKALRRNGARQRWTIGFRVLDGEQTGRVHRIRNLDVYTISPAIDEVKAVGHAASYRSAAVEIKATDAAPYRPVVRGPPRWAGCPRRTARPVRGVREGRRCGQPLHRRKGRICADCVEVVGHVLDDLGALDATPDEVYEQAQRDEQVAHADIDGTVRPGPRDRRWRP